MKMKNNQRKRIDTISVAQFRFIAVFIWMLAIVRPLHLELVPYRACEKQKLPSAIFIWHIAAWWAIWIKGTKSQSKHTVCNDACLSM